MSRTPKTHDSRLTTHDFLLEIGCEELPADYLPAVLDWERQGPTVTGGLASWAAVILGEKGVVWESLQSFATCRRLVLQVRGVQPVAKKWEKGPPVSVAYDAQGKPTRAAEAFAARHHLKVSQLKREDTPKGPVLLAKYDEPVTKSLSEAIPEILPKVVFPKTMRWDETKVRFARPIRWMLSLYGAQVVPASFGTVRCGNITYGTRRSDGKPVKVSGARDYFLKLSCLQVELEHGLILRPKENHPHEFEEPHPLKREGLRKRLEQAAKRLKGRLPDQKTEEFQWLLNTVTFLAENPVVQGGTFRSNYLDLPPEVLATSMAKHLKLFSVYEQGGKRLRPRFLAVLEGKPRKPAMVMANLERILEARFSDARFFYREDTKSPLEAKVTGLHQVIFHEKLGSVADRIPRLRGLMNAIARQVKGPVEATIGIDRVVALCKMDLVTQMVREFPSLQGLIGGHYAHRGGESEAVAQAISEQYRPRTVNDPVPATPLGALLSLSDRFDTLLGFFGVGLKPTGSLDPYALRRQALGFVRILLEPPPGISFVGLSIDRLLDVGIESWGPKIAVEPKTLKKEVGAFLQDRFEWLAFERDKIDRELVAAVLAADSDDLAGAWERLKLLRGLWAGPNRQDRQRLERAAKVAQRSGRIVQSAKLADGLGSVDPEVFKESLERKLWETWNRVAPTLKEQVRRRQYVQAVKTYGSLYPQIHEFFEKVFVMDEDPKVRNNRLVFMREIFQALSGSFADLSKLPLAGVEPS